jgi:hypothetical protein
MFYTYKNTKLTLNSRDILVSEATISVNSTNNPVYNIEDRHSFVYTPANGIGGSLRFKYFLTGEDFLKKFHSEEKTVIAGHFGGLTFASGYLKTWELSCSPNTPVVIDAEIVFFDELKGTFTPTYEQAGELNIFNLSDATLQDSNKNKVGSLSNITSLVFTFESEINPVYAIGETLPERVNFGRKSITTSLETDTIAGDLPIYGKDAGLKITFVHPNVPNFAETFECEGILYQRNISTSAGQIVRNQLAIKQHYLQADVFVSGLSPQVGHPGIWVKFTGYGLGTTNKILFNDDPSPDIRIVSDSEVSGFVPSGAVTGPVTIFANGGSHSPTDWFGVVYYPIVIDQVTPITGAIETKVRIVGNNFYKVSEVKFSDQSASFTVLNPNVIEAYVPEFAAWDKIYVISQARNLTGASTNRFVPIPRIDSFSPVSGISGDIITIAGRGFSGLTFVGFNNIPAASFTVLSNTGVQAVVPSGNTFGFISVSGQSGVYARSLTRFEPSVRVSGLIPSSGFTGASVDILGENFNAEMLYQIGNTNTFIVGFGSVTGAFTRINNTKLQGVVPYGAQTGPVYIYNKDLIAYPSTGHFKVLNGPPTINSLVPSSGKFGDWININGSNYYNVNKIVISGKYIETGISGSSLVVSELADIISFQIPNVSGGKYHVTVDTFAGKVTGLNALTVLVSPIISGIAPTSGVLGQEIRLTGNNLYPNSRVFIGNTGVETTIKTGSFNDAYTSLIFTIPSHCPTGGNIIVYNGVGYATGTHFTLIKFPVVSGFIPLSGEWDQTITVTGNYFGTVTGVQLGSIPQRDVVVFAQTGLTFKIREDSETNFIGLFGSGQPQYSPTQLQVLIPLVIFSGFQPTGVRYGDTLTLSGKYFQTVDEIRFTGNAGNEVVVTNFTGISNSGIKVRVPDNIIDGKIKLVNERGITQSSQTLLIKPEAGVITMSPDYGVYEDIIHLSGINLNDYDYYFPTWGGRYVRSLLPSYLGTTGVRLPVPRDIIKGPLLMSGFDGNLRVTTMSFTPLPTISGFVPTGLVSGQVVTLTGINATELASYLGISGTENQLVNLITNSSNFSVDISRITGATDVSTGYSIITATINASYGGSGKLFLVSNKDNLVSDFSNISSSKTYQRLSQALSRRYLYIIHSAPTITNFTPLSGTSATTVFLRGSNLISTTGIDFINGATLATGLGLTYSNPLVTLYPPNNFVEISGQIRIKTKFGTVTSNDYFIFNQPVQIIEYRRHFMLGGM